MAIHSCLNRTVKTNKTKEINHPQIADDFFFFVREIILF